MGNRIIPGKSNHHIASAVITGIKKLSVQPILKNSAAVVQSAIARIWGRKFNMTVSDEKSARDTTTDNIVNTSTPTLPSIDLFLYFRLINLPP